MFGDRFFRNREELFSTVEDVCALAKQLKVPTDEFTTSDIYNFVTAPFCILTLGEVNVGKSSLLNCLFEQSLAPVKPNPSSDLVHDYRLGSAEKSSELSPAHQLDLRPHSFLSHFRLIDPPGTNSFVKGQAEVVESLVPEAEIILCVLTVENPWSASTWDALGSLSEADQKKVILILNKIESREARDVDVIRDHVRRLAGQRMSRVPHLYAVSITDALSQNPDQKARSGIRELRTAIDDAVGYNVKRATALRQMYGETFNLLAEVETAINERTDDVESQIMFIRHLELDIGKLRKLHGAEKGQAYLSLSEVFEQVVKDALETLREGLSLRRSLKAIFFGSRLPGEVEGSLLENTESEIGIRALDDGARLVEICADHWKTLVPRVEDRLSLSPGKFDKESESFRKTRDQFSRVLSRAARQAVVKLRLRAVLDVMLMRRLQVLRFIAGLALMMITLASFAGAVGLPLFVSIFFLGLGVLLGLGGFAFGLMSGRQVTASYRERALSARREFVNHLRSDYSDGVQQFFTEYGLMLEGVRRGVGQSKSSIKPLQDEWRKCFLRLKANEQLM